VRHTMRLYLVALVALSLVAVGCSQAAPAPTPTKAAAQPAKAAEPTKAAAPQATAAPAKKVDYPTKGKVLNIIVPYAAGGGGDLTGRLLAASLEKELGITVEVLNKAGGGGQVGITELAKAKPDGYTIGFTNMPHTIPVYLDPERKAAFGRKDLQPLANVVSDPVAIIAKKGGPYNTLKDLVEAAKTNPKKVKITGSGLLNPSHIATLLLQKEAGVEFSYVVYDQQGEQRAALLGGHMDAEAGPVSEIAQSVKAGDCIALAVLDKEESKYLPGAKTADAQGFKVNVASARGVSAPAAVPKEIIELLDKAIGKVMDLEDTKKKQDELMLVPRYMNTAAYTAYWDGLEKDVQPLIELSKQK